MEPMIAGFYKHRNLVLLSTVVLLLTACERNTVTGLEGSGPNIVFILADDLGWADLPVYGNRFNEASHLDRLAEEGIRFTNAYAAAPVCSPTRASIISGQYPVRVGITDFITGHWRPYEEVIVPRNRNQFLPLELNTLGEVMKQAGYTTGYFGKWHLGGASYYPDKQGFDEVNVYQGGGFFQYAERMSSPVQVDEGTPLSAALTRMGTDFIDRHRNEPFFLFLAHYDVHVQLDADSLLIEKYLNKQKEEGYPCNAVYAAMVESVDRSVGSILGKLKELDLDRNTLVVFFSDNGGLVSRFDRIPLIAESKRYIYEGDTLLYVASSNAPLRGEKGTLYEGGIREPLIMWWPGTLQEGRVCHDLVSSVDFLPTFARIAGVEGNPSQVTDGSDLTSLLEGQKADPERALFWHYPVYHHDAPASAVRKGKWKLIRRLVDNTYELYNLEEDPGESVNLRDTEQEVATGMIGLLDKWYSEVEAEFPQTNPAFDVDLRHFWGTHPDNE